MNVGMVGFVIDVVVGVVGVVVVGAGSVVVCVDGVGQGGRWRERSES